MSDKVITIAIFSTIVQAQYAKDALEDAGVEVTLAGENTITNSALYASAVGNIRVQILESQLDKATLVIGQVYKDLEDSKENPIDIEEEVWQKKEDLPDETGPLSRKESTAKKIILVSLLLGALFAVGLFTYKFSGLFNKLSGDQKGSFTLSLLPHSDGNCDHEATKLILEQRLLNYGLSNRNITIDSKDELLYVEVSGVDDLQRIEKLLTSWGKLEFWETYENPEVYGFLQQINTLLRTTKKTTTNEQWSVGTLNSNLTTESANQQIIEIIIDTVSIEKSLKEILDNGKWVNAEEENETENPTSLIDQIRELEGEDEQGSQDLRTQNPLFSILQPAVYQSDYGEYFLAEGPVVGYVALVDTALVNSALNSAVANDILPVDLKFMWESRAYDDAEEYFRLIAIRTGLGEKALLGNDAIEEAYVDFVEHSNEPVVSIKMNKEAAREWRRMTSDNVGRSIAVALDDKAYMFPKVTAVIPGGFSRLSGGFSIYDARILATIIMTEPLPCKVMLTGKDIPFIK